MTIPTPTVLFVCVHNAGRSQMAAGWLKQLAGDRIQVWSAGSEPADRINPTAVQAMREVGIDITGETPKILTTDSVAGADVVVTMGCGDSCPFYPGKRYEDWQLTDPAGQPIEVVREVRDEIKARIEALVAELLGTTGPISSQPMSSQPMSSQPMSSRSMSIQPMTEAHAAAVLAIYRAGIDEGNATFETSPPSWQEFTASRMPDHRFVAVDDRGAVLGWIAVVPVSDRCVYSGVVEHSVYVSPSARGLGVGRALLDIVIASTEAAGIWTIQSGIFPENVASAALHRAAGFREVGRRERIGQRHGIWRDVILIERRSRTVGC
jgi:L-amino acid N-acyltransferase YncA/protein-tyrosine-phosphatase